MAGKKKAEEKLKFFQKGCIEKALPEFRKNFVDNFFLAKKWSFNWTKKRKGFKLLWPHLTVNIIDTNLTLIYEFTEQFIRVNSNQLALYKRKITKQSYTITKLKDYLQTGTEETKNNHAN